MPAAGSHPASDVADMASAVEAPITPAFELALTASFGGVTPWALDFAAAAAVDGWGLLVFEPQAGRLVNCSAAQAAAKQGVPLWAFDNRAAVLGTNPADAAARITASVPWARVYERYQRAVHIASEGFAAAQNEVGDALLLDVRRAGVYAQARSVIPGARWHDPAGVEAWANDLPAGRDVIVYCVYGHEVGRATALRLRAAGVNARYLSGGIDAWQAAAKPLEAKPEAAS